MIHIKRFKLFESEWINQEKYDIGEYILISNNLGEFFAKIKFLYNHASLGPQKFFKIKVINDYDDTIDIKSTDVIRHLTDDEILTFNKNIRENRHR